MSTAERVRARILNVTAGKAPSNEVQTVSDAQRYPTLPSPSQS
jgi:hypothetical protein